ncbi:transmembrane protein 94-like isoform X2 [Triplophysa dalaica]|uniref:transmembrane protein 94-like isoform X2 n=1 Tax=Triplophysa dalaica TaxID=1582913 RepID=UPI0024E01CB5|nr:transmembrane protein 94-like isoform X2 [Triplophysa dalaica]
MDCPVNGAKMIYRQKAPQNDLHNILKSFQDDLMKCYSLYYMPNVAWSRYFLHHSVRCSSLHWSGVLLTVLCAASLITCHIIDPNSDGKALIGGCTLLLLLLTGLIAMTTRQGLQRGDAQQRGDFTQHFTGRGTPRPV